MIKETYDALTDFMKANFDGIKTQVSDLSRLIKRFNEIKANLENIREFNKVYLTGCGDSYYVSMISKFFFEEHLPTSVEALPALELAYYKEHKLDAKTLVIASSASGKTIRTVEAAKNARKKGCQVICVTNSKARTPLANVSDIVIPLDCSTPLGWSPSKTSTATLLAHFLIALSLADNFKKLESNCHLTLKEIYDALEFLKHALSEFEEKASALAEGLKQRDVFQFIGGGPSYGAACIGAAKIKELSLGYAEATELEEFCHAQILTIEEKTPVFLFLVEGRTYKRSIEVLAGLKRINASPIILTNTVGEHIDYALSIVKTPENISENISQLLYLPFMQFFAFFLAVKKGVNPSWFKQPHASAVKITYQQESNL
ncbi:MAG: SIS domain-containing protein [Candidatus Odinarchaeia archaeon]